MDKQQIISFIEGQLQSGHITKGDLLNLAGGAPQAIDQNIPQNSPQTQTSSSPKEDTSKRLIHIFYAIGAIIVVIGVIILIAQNWEEIGFAGRVLVTLGISLATYISGLIFSKPEQRVISQVMFTISAALAPVGIYVLLNEANVKMTENLMLLISGSLTIIYGAALLISKRNILFLITLAFGTWTYYAGIIKILGESHFDEDLLKWSTMLLGFAFLFIGYGYRSAWKTKSPSDEKEKNAVQNIVISAGTLAILSAGISIGGTFDLIFIAFIFAAFYGSVYLKNRTMLMFGAFFLMAHIIKLTSKYFVDSVGWPLALIVIGFLIIAVGYLTFYLNRKFWAKSKVV